jgi:hypothetical protein
VWKFAPKQNGHCHDRILLTNNSLDIVFINIVTKLNVTFNLLSFNKSKGAYHYINW